MIKEKRWTYHRFDEDEVNAIADAIQGPPILAEVLHASGFGFKNLDQLDRFIHPKMDEIMSYQGISSPYHLNKSLDRLARAKANNEHILVNGDPDADGISGTTILTTGLRQLGFTVDYAFPIRSREGHGLQIRIIQEAKAKGVSLIITTDCGTKDVEAVAYANENGIDVIITDHHILGKKLPDAVAIINPYTTTDPAMAEFRYLSGSYVSFKWIIALKEFFKETFPKPIFETLAIASCFGIISDRVSLKYPMNRAMVSLGIKYLNSTSLVGMKALKRISLPTRTFLRARDISRTIAPRMNAPGRIGDPLLGIPDSGVVVDLLMAGLTVGPDANVEECLDRYKHVLDQDNLIKNNLNVSDQVQIVDSVNDQRKQITEKIETQIEKYIESVDLSREKVLIVKGKKWNSGVIGIDADRLRDRFVLPAIIITTLEGSDFLKGSVRSIPSINMYQIMENVQQRFQEKYGRNPYQITIDTVLGSRQVNAFGGHAQACGFSMNEADFDEWKAMIQQEMEAIPPQQYEFSYRVLKEVSFFDINLKLLNALDQIAPYGEGFDFPIFSLKGVRLSENPRPFGNRMQQDRTPHVEFKVLHTVKGKSTRTKTHVLSATGFGLWERYQNVVSSTTGYRADLIFTVDYPHKKNKKSRFPELTILDIRPASDAG
jgi:single-stranded-DNA-specific exonuclease